MIGQCFHNKRFAFFETGDYLAFGFKLCFVAACTGNVHHTIAQEAVAHRDAIAFQAQYLRWHYLVAVQAHKAMGRAYKMHGAAIGALVAHHLRNGQFGGGHFKCFVQRFFKGFASLRTRNVQHILLAIVDAFQLVHTDCTQSQRIEFFLQRRGGLAVRIQTNFYR